MKTKKSLLSQCRLMIVATIVACAFSTPRAYAQTCVGDSLALVEIYNATNGASWTNSANWLTGPWRPGQVLRLPTIALPFLPCLSTTLRAHCLITCWASCKAYPAEPAWKQYYRSGSFCCLYSCKNFRYWICLETNLRAAYLQH